MKTQSTPNDRVQQSRSIEQIIAGQATSDGAGVKLTRMLGPDLHHRLDPFLMLDAFGSDTPQDYIAGFPDHPHRGFETLTYLLAGRMRHKDNAGHQGVIETGGIQWMTAGRGIIHSEMPEQKNGLLQGFQLWINLPAESKMQAPAYHDVQAEEIPELTTTDGIAVKVIAGNSHGVAGAIHRPVTEPLILDLQMPAGSVFNQLIPAAFQAFLLVYAGEITVHERRVSAQRMAVLANAAGADGISITAESDSRIFLVAGKPLREPIVQRGPFVMNTPEEIAQAFEDYQAGRFAA